MSESKALKYVEEKGWETKPSGVDNLAIETCPFCGNNEYKFRINISGETDGDEKSKDGLFDCKTCSEKGNLYQLKLKLGDRIQGVSSLKDSVPPLDNPNEPQTPALDVDKAASELHERDKFGNMLEYLVGERSFTTEALKRMKIGAIESRGKQWIAFPYLSKEGTAKFVKYRSFGEGKKEFFSTPGEARLYNGTILEPGLEELVFVEGEMDVLSCLSNGINNVVGVPGANTQKSTWIDKIDAIAPKKIILLYDSDKVGQDAAEEMAKKLGKEKCFNIKLPEFLKEDGKPGKDINEWFQSGKTKEDFLELVKSAKQFDVGGVQDTKSIITELRYDIEHKGSQRWDVDSQWEPLNRKMGGCCWGEVVGIIAEGKVGKTTFALNWLDYLANKFSLNCFMFCLEMPTKTLVRKWISYKTQTDDSPDKSDFTVKTVDDGMEIARQMNGDILWGFAKVGQKTETIFETIRQVVRRYGVKVVCFDNLQFLVRSLDHTAQETANMSKKFKELAMELGILIILIIQPNRVREGEIVAARNSNGSSAIEKDVDNMIALHRNRVAKIKSHEFNGFLDCDDNFEPQLLCRVDLSRFAPGGVCTLMMDGAKSTVKEFSQQDLSSLPAPATGSLSNISVEV